MSYNYYLIYQKKDFLKFISHLDLSLLFRRLLLRAQMPVEITQGYNPRIRMSFCPALSLGIEGWGEVMELTLTESLPEEEIKKRINNVAPIGLNIERVEKVLNKRNSLSKILKYATYLIILSFSNTTEEKKVLEHYKKMKLSIKNILEQDVVKVKKESEKGIRYIDIRPFIYNINILPENEDNKISIQLTLNMVSGHSINPVLIIEKILEYADNNKEIYIIEEIIRENFILQNNKS